MNVLVTGANGQLGMCLRDQAKGSFVFTDVVDIPELETIHLDLAVVNEQVVAISAGDEAVALVRIEPLNSTLSHFVPF